MDTNPSGDLTKTFSVDRSPAAAYQAVIDPRRWWSGEIEGRTDELGAEFTYRVPGVHSSTFRITELVPDERVAWHVTDSYLSFTDDHEEWTGTTVVFDIVARDGHTEIRFTHEGLRPDHECYDVCSAAWGTYVTESLRALIATGAGQPSSFEGEAALAAVRATEQAS